MTTEPKIEDIAEPLLRIELPKMIAHVRDDVLPHYTPEVIGTFAANMMKADIAKAEKAIADNDLMAMWRIYQELKTWNI